MTIDEMINLHEMKAIAAKSFSTETTEGRTAICYTAKEHEEIAAKLKELRNLRTEVTELHCEMQATRAFLKERDQETREKAIDEFATRMISMMPGHKQDILQIVELLKDTEKDCDYER